MSHLDVDVTAHDGYAVALVTGDVDYFTSETFRGCLDQASEAHPVLVVDLNPMTFMDSAGLGELVRVWKKLSASGGHLAVVCSSPIVLRLLAITGVDQVLEIHSSVEDAVAESTESAG